jgi:sterol desaturase/sphingolipid hydroxylase (fatty acid hydroxylase superfamily)
MVFVVCGVLSWLVAEYWIHRLLGHVVRANTPFKVEHVRHHSEGNYFAPAPKKALAAVALMPAITGVAWVVLPIPEALLYAGGFLGMYLLYEVIHYGIHAWPARSPYGRWIRRHHLMHHFNTATKNHAVCVPLFDRLWGTHRAVEKVRVPRTLAPPWMRALPGGAWSPGGTTFQLVD